MKLVKKIFTSALILTTALGLAACGGGEEKKEATNDAGSIYFLNSKPEVDKVWEEIAKTYTEETGVPMKVVTAASGSYDSTLKSEMTKKEAPTIFQINGSMYYEKWKDYTKDLKDMELYSHLVNKDLAITEGEGVYGLPYVVEGYGIIYNDGLFQKYLSLPGSKVKSMDEVNNFAKLKEVVEDVQAKKDDLGIEGAFAATSLVPGEDWRWSAHLANISVFYECRDDKVADKDVLDFRYDKEFKNIFDLYLNNSTVSPEATTSKAVTDSMGEFALEKAMFVQNGNWAWSQIADVSGNKLKEENVKFIPIYTGMDGEEKQNMAIGCGGYFSINSKASEKDQKASEDFINWLFTSEKGKAYVRDDLGFIAPFDTFKEEDLPKDPLAKEVARYMKNTDLYIVDSNFTNFPSQTFKDYFGQALGQYALGSMEWKDVKQAFIDSWKEEKAAGKAE